MIRYPRIIAHRCGGHLAMENSIAGLLAAKHAGCRAVEFDVMLTRDAVPILMHDATLDRTTRCQGVVADMTLAEIRACDARVPTLGEAIGMCERLGLWANVELKPATGRATETGAVVGRWLARHWHGNGVVSSFSEDAAARARHELPNAAFALLCDRLPEDWQARRERLGAVAVHLNAAHADEAMAHDLASAGIAWAAWTVNDAALAQRMFSLGAAAIFTDRPDLC
ncbi:glycerophosphodiester phosphodiesterase family protein [Sulfuricystis multivorans]|uniref:glycerophosphodiester phosphodiesterase family protein n=1 Tax=Sulfuricystis multivorans TaxID=2211108 RepID=UPI000F82AEE8|nr:glycerophosphodiester phosphodiesterase family protein [Sulfuricystis multivorans]